MAEESNVDYCQNGNHYIVDGNQAVKVGTCPGLDDHEEGPQNPKAQVLQAAQQAGQAKDGKPQTGFGMDDTVLSPSMDNLKAGLGL